MEKKHAYLIMAHNNIDLLLILLSLIDHKLNDIYVHLDKRMKFSDYEQITNAVQQAKIFIYEEFKIYWGDFTQVKCELFLLEKAKEHYEYSYYHLLSGSDLPLRSQDDIHSFFDNNNGKEFVQFFSVDTPKNVIDWVNYYHIFQRYMRISKYKFINNIFDYLERVSILIQKALRIKRIHDVNIIKKGATWFSITNNLVEYILGRKAWIYNAFQYTRSSDEIFLQTIIWNSVYINNLFNKEMNDNYISCMRYVDWKRGKPYTFRLEDYGDLIDSNYLFARKFNMEVDRDIIYRIRDSVASNNRNNSTL